VFSEFYHNKIHEAILPVEAVRDPDFSQSAFAGGLAFSSNKSVIIKAA